MSNQNLRKYLRPFSIADQHRLLKGVSYLFIYYMIVYVMKTVVLMLVIKTIKVILKLNN